MSIPNQKHPLNPNVNIHPSPPFTGEWVKFKTTELPAHSFKSPDGYNVGIYVRQSVDSLGQVIKEHIAPVDQDGNNLFPFPKYIDGEISGEFKSIYNKVADGKYVLREGFEHIQLDPTTVTELHHAEDLNDLPQNRIQKTLKVDPNHKLPAWYRRQKCQRQ